MIKIAVLINDGFEDIETIVPIDIWNRFDFLVDIFSMSNSSQVKGAYGCTLTVEKKIEDLEPKNYDAVFLPGGPQYKSNLNNKILKSKLEIFKQLNKYFFAICAAPTVLASFNLINNSKATCFFGMEKEYKNVNWQKTQVCVDQKLITARGPGAAYDFAFVCANQFVDKKLIWEEHDEASFLPKSVLDEFVEK